MRDDMNRRAIATLSAGHGGVDFTSGAIPALIPFLVAEFDLDYASAGVLMLALTASSSLVQPLFGLWSDRRGALWLLPGGLALAAVGTALVAVAPVYPAAVALTFAAGIGIAAYHPEGAKFAAYASSARRASGMSLFNVGGNLGYALGPIVVTPLVLWLGLEGGALVAVPALLVSIALVAGAAQACEAPADARLGRRDVGRDEGRGDGDPRRRHCASERRVVRAPGVRSALGRVAGWERR